MQILKYIIFLSILSGIFFLIYRESDDKGFRKWWTSLRMAVLIAAILAGLIPNLVEAIEPRVSNNSPSIERVLSNQELDSLDDPNSLIILVKTVDSSPSVPISPGRGQPSQFPTPPSGGRPNWPVYVPKYRTAPKIVDKGLGAGANPAGAGGGSGAAEFEDQCPTPKNQQSQESKISNYDSHYKDKKKKRKNSHLDRKVEINEHNFEIERAQVEKKTPRHGVDLGLDPDIGVDGKPILNQKTQKPMAKGNKENYELFADNLEKFMENSEMRDGYFRKGRENQQETFNFYDAETNRVASFRKDNGKFISFWKMDEPDQTDEFLNNNNLI
jgi:hypothetical protein